MGASIFRKIACTSLMLVLAIQPEGVYSTASAKSTTKSHIQVQAKDTFYSQDDLQFIQKLKQHIMETRLSEQQTQMKAEQQRVVPVGAESVSVSIESASIKYNVPVKLLYAQAYTESRFNPNQTGALGDVGLFQILPSTAYEINRLHFNIQGFSPSMLYNPNLNAEFACWYLNYLHQFASSWESTLTAYNMGLGGLHKYGSYSPYYQRVCTSHEKLFGNQLFL